MKRLISILAVAVGLSVTAETFYWKNDQSDRTRDFGVPENWAVGTTADAGNPLNLVPTATDDICYGNPHDNWNNLFFIGLQDKDWSVKDLVGGRPSDDQFRYWHLYHGSLTFTGDVGNKRWYVYAHTGSRFVLGPTSEGLFGVKSGGGVVPGFTAEAGGEIDFLGTMTISSIRMIANEGGKIVFGPTWIGGDADTFGKNNEAYLKNAGGVIECPNGIYFQGSGPDWDGYFHVYQNSGTMVLGGPVKHNSHKCRLQFHLSGGTLRVTNDVSFSSDGNNALYKREMTEGATVTVEVDESKKIDFSTVEFGANTTILKEGYGRVSFSDALPSILTVSDGECFISSGIALGSRLRMSVDTTLVLDSLGISATAIDGIDGATVKVSEKVGNGLLFASSDGALVATVAAKLAASSSDLGSFAVTAEGVQYVQKRDPLVFSWVHDHDTSGTYYAYRSPSSWAVGSSPSGGNPQGLIPTEIDDICYGEPDGWNNNVYIDCGDGDFSVRNLLNGRPDDDYFRYWRIRKGSLTFSGTVDCKRWYVYAYTGARFVLGPTSEGLFGVKSGGGVVPGFTAEAGGEIDFLGTMTISSIRMIANEGGKIVFGPTWIGGDADTFGKNNEAYLKNAGGVIECPNGIYFQGSGPDWDGYFHVYQNSGTMVLGGPVKHNSHKCRLQFHLSGGTLRVTNDVSFSSDGNNALYKREMTEGATVTVEVDEGKKIDFSTVEFGANTTLYKKGKGRIKFDAENRPSVYQNLEPNGLILMVR